MPYYEVGYSRPEVSREREVFMSSCISGISFMEKPKYGKWPFAEIELEIFSHSEARLKALRNCTVVIKNETEDSGFMVIDAKTNLPSLINNPQNKDLLFHVRLRKRQILKLNKQSFYVLGSPSLQVKWLETIDFKDAAESIEWGVNWNLANLKVDPIEIPLDMPKQARI